MTSYAKRSSRKVRLAIDEGLLLKLATAGILLALILAVALLRLQRLGELPPGVVGDEGRPAAVALQVLQGKHAIFFSNVDDGGGREPSVIYALALFTSLFGRTLLAMHLPTALGSAGMVFVTFWVGQLFFGRDEESGRATPWRGLLVGGVGAGLMVVSIGQTILGRTAYNNTTHMPVLLTLCLGLLWWGWQERSWWRVMLAGACAGLLPYTYMAARLVPFLFLFLGLSFLLPFSAAARAKARAELPWAGVFLGVAGLVAAPILVYFVLHPEHFFLRSQYLWVFDSDLQQGSPLGTFLNNVWDHLSVLGFRGDPSWRNNFAGQPMLNPWEATFFWFGVSMAVWRWQRPAYRLLLFWLAIMTMPAFLARDSLSPSTMRMIGAAPAIYLLVGVGIWEAYRFLKGRLSGQMLSGLSLLCGTALCVAVLAQGIVTYRTYFQYWAAAPEVQKAYLPPLTDLIRVLNAQPPDESTINLIPNLDGDYNVDYLYTGAAPAHLVDPFRPVLAQEIESALKATEKVSTLKVVEWTANVIRVGGDVERIAFLLSKYGRYLGSEEHSIFRIHSYTDISLDRPWTFYEHLEPLTVDYDGGIALQGLALGQGAEQMSSRQLPSLARDRPLWMALRWQTAPGLDVDYAISLRLYNAAGARVYQEDIVLWSPSHWPTSHWSADAPVDTLALLAVPADLPAGNYELRLVVYNFDTLVPTVERGVWEPETTLAHLRLAESQ